MIYIKSHFKSIFDTIEDKAAIQNILEWKPVCCSLTDQQCIMELNLFTKTDGQYRQSTYRLIPHYIQSLAETPAYLNITNARLCKISDITNHMYGIRLMGYKGLYEFYCKTTDEQSAFFNKIKTFCTLFHITNEYSIKGLIGRGNYSKVHLGGKLGTKESYAIKSIEKPKIIESINSTRSLLKEIDLLRIIEHPNVIKLYEVYEDETHIHIVLEHLKGGELFRHIQQKGAYNEYDAAKVMKQLLSALCYIHKRGIIHRDLKPENIIVSEIGASGIFKIADFGLATMTAGNLETIRCGSPGYVAPEVLSGSGYNSKADIFSAGAILYALLTGEPLFNGKTYQEVLSKNMACNLVFPDILWNNVSSLARSLVQSMLEKDPNKRYSALDCLNHEWIKNEAITPTAPLPGAIENLKKYCISDIKTKKKTNLECDGMPTCTPVMTGRDLLEISPFMAPKPLVMSNEKRAMLEGNCPKTPMIASYFKTHPKKGEANEALSILSKIAGKAKKQEVCKEITENYHTDMEERICVHIKEIN